VVQKGEPISLADVTADARTAELPAEDLPNIGPVILVPIRLGEGTQGVLAMGWAPDHADRYHQVDAAMPAGFAEQATLALQLARVREDRERLAVLEDRDRIARDLHDLVIQRLFAIGLGLQGTARLAIRPETTERLERAIDDLDATIKDIRRTIFALGSTESAGDIQSEATQLVERARSTLKFRPKLEFEGPVRSLVTGTLATDVLAAMGEALSNASRHAEATEVTVRLAANDHVVLTVSDNGRGLPKDYAESGLANIRDRAESHGGTVDLASQPGGGTRLTWTVPLSGHTH
jgi:signal transduction histidine kinase